MLTQFEVILFLVSVLAAGLAAVSGFGIGSLLTPLLATQLDTKLAVAAVSIPHLIATSWRCWSLRQHIDKKIFVHFGILSAVGGLAGAGLHAYVKDGTLTLIFGLILVMAGALGLSGMNERMRLSPSAARLAGVLSGIFGGMVGNQGGIRSAALLGFRISPAAFVATATAVGVIVDLARMPVYLSNHGAELIPQWPLLLISSAGVLVGTAVGMNVLTRLPVRTFKLCVSGLILLMGLFMIYKGI